MQQISVKRLQVMEMRDGRCKGDRRWEEVLNNAQEDDSDPDGMTTAAGLLGVICIALTMIIYAMQLGLM